MPIFSPERYSIYKESVELTFVYLLEGCGKTLSKISDTIPHTRIDMGYRVRRTRPATGIYTKVSVVPSRLLLLKTSTFSNKDLRKTLSQICNIRRQKPHDSTNLRKSFYKRTTLTGVLQNNTDKKTTTLSRSATTHRAGVKQIAHPTHLDPSVTSKVI